MNEMTESRLRVFLPLEPEDPMTAVNRLLPALVEPGRTVIRRFFVCRPIEMDFFVPEMTYQLPEISRLELEAQMAASDRSRRATQPLADLGFRVESEVACGPPIPEILREVDVWRAEIAMVRARRAGAADGRLGAVASALLHQGTCPVLVYRDVPADYRLRRILIATDFSSSSRTASDWGLALAEVAGAEAHLLHVLPDHGLRSSIGERRLLDAADREIRRWRETADPAFARPMTDAHVISAVTPADGVLKFAADMDFDLIVTATTGRSATWAVLLGSNARRIARDSRVPVFAITRSNRVSPRTLLEKLQPAEIHASAGRP